MNSVTNSTSVLAEPLLQERSHGGARCSKKVVSFLALLIGLGFAVVASTQRNVLESGITMAYLGSAPGLQRTVPGFPGIRTSPAKSFVFGAWQHSQGRVTQNQVPGRLRRVQAQVSSNDMPDDASILQKRIAEMREREDASSALSSSDMAELTNRIDRLQKSQDMSDLGSNDMATLQKRMAALGERQVGVLNITVSDSIPLPAQRITLKVPWSVDFRVGDTVGVVGIWPPESGQLLPLGTEMEIVGLSGSAYNRMGVQLELMGIRRFQLDGELQMQEGGSTQARVEFISDSPLGDADEVTPATLMKSSALGPLVEEWTQLVRNGHFEKFAGQVSNILSQLGPMPPAMEPARRAIWVAALVNPTPSDGLSVAYEVRPAMLMAHNNAEMVSLATYALTTSIEILKRRAAESSVQDQHP